MARKLFSLENDDTGAISEDMVDDSVGEVADVQTEVTDDTGDISEDVGGVEEGIDATDSLDQVEDLVEGAVESGEGLDPVAAEAIRIAIEAVCSRVGADPKAIYSLYATENFSSPSSRKSNSGIALEGVKEFLKDMWAKIKASLTNIWTKVKAFWAKHVSTLGRVKKALESMKAKVSSSTGKLTGQAFVDEAPSGLVSAFAGKDDINAKTVGDYIARHKVYTGESSEVTTTVTKLNEVAASIKDLKDFTNPQFGRAVEDYAKAFGGGKDAKKYNPLIGGIDLVITAEQSASADEAVFEMTVEKNETDNKEAKLGVSIASKDQLKSLLTDCLTVINETVKIKDKADKLESAVQKALGAISNVVNSTDVGGNDALKEGMKLIRNNVKVMYKIDAKTPMLMSDTVNFNVKLAKAVLGYSAFCLKNYK